MQKLITKAGTAEERVYSRWLRSNDLASRYGQQLQTYLQFDEFWTAVRESLRRLLRSLLDKIQACEILLRPVIAVEDQDARLSPNDRARRCREQGDLAGAEAAYREILNAYRGSVGPNAPECQTCLYNIADTCFLQGNLEEAISVFRKVLEIRRMTSKDRNLEAADCLSGFASALQARGDLHEAQASSMAALQIRRELLGPKHPETLLNEQDLTYLTSILASSPPLPVCTTCVSDAAPPMMASIDTEDNPVENVVEVLIAPRQIDSGTAREAFSSTVAMSETIAMPDAATHSPTLAMLTQVLSLTFKDGRKDSALLHCQDEARQLYSIVNGNRGAEKEPSASDIATRNQPFSALLTLADARAALTDQRWAALHAQVSEAFGRSLALAASQGRLISQTTLKTNPKKSL